MPFDLEQLEVTGDAVIVARDVGMESIFGNVHVAVSDNGTLAYVAGRDLTLGRLAWVDRQDGAGDLGAPERVYNVLDLGPDGRQVAVQVTDVSDCVWVWDTPSETGRILAPGASLPRWDFTGERIACVSGGDGRQRSADGSGRSQRRGSCCRPGKIPTGGRGPGSSHRRRPRAPKCTSSSIGSRS